MNVYVSMFGSLAEISGKQFMVLENVKDTDSLTQRIKSLFPLIGKYSFKLAVKHAIVNANTPLNNGDEVAFLPPFAGG